MSLWIYGHLKKLSQLLTCIYIKEKKPVKTVWFLTVDVLGKLKLGATEVRLGYVCFTQNLKRTTDVIYTSIQLWW